MTMSSVPCGSVGCPLRGILAVAGILAAIPAQNVRGSAPHGRGNRRRSECVFGQRHAPLR